MYLFSWVSEKRYFLLCDVCHRGSELDATAVEATLTEHPIPFITRYGWTLIFLILPVVLALVGFEGSYRKSRDLAYISSPKQGDLYVVNVRDLLHTSPTPYIYGAMKVTFAAGDRADFQLSYARFTNPTGVTGAISSGAALSPDYYGGPIGTISIGELQTLREKGVIGSVRRGCKKIAQSLATCD
jgi:hypothetical protein